MTKRIVFVFLVSLFVAVAFVSCAGSSSVQDAASVPYKTFDEAMDAGDLKAALILLQKEKPIKKDAIRQTLDVAFLQHFTKDYTDSEKGLEKANKAIIDSVTKSITRGAMTYIANDNASEYTGTVYENHYINVFNALNYYNQGNIEDAIVEIRDLIRKQQLFDQINATVTQELTDAENEEENSTDKTGKSFSSAANTIGMDVNEAKANQPRKATSQDCFTYSPTERYLAIMLYAQQIAQDMIPQELVSEALNEIQRQTPLLAQVASYPIQDDLLIDDNGFAKNPDVGRLNVLAFCGRISKRTEHVITIPIFVPISNDKKTIIVQAQLKYTYPEFNKDAIQYPVSSCRIKIDGYDTIHLQLLENFNDAVEKDVAVKARPAFTRSLIRSTFKKAATVVSAHVVAQFSQAAAELMIISSNALDLTERADIRQVVTLPALAHAGGITLPPGTYSFTVQYCDPFGSVVAEESFSNIQINAGKPTFIESTCIR
ncbi:MAG: hypothetical protein K6E51_10700 [Treponema sp.]|nr:hypothetical protein [Treponema sp.]